MRSAPGSFATSAAATTVLLATAACDPTRAPIHTRHTDSAGIPIATAVTPLWGPGDGWTVEAEPLVEIGSVSGAPEYQFADVVAVVRLSNGDIVVADRGASELRSFDNEGVFIWSAGREGEGPGEFRSLEFLGAKAGDSLVAPYYVAGADPPPFEVFAPDGAWLGTVALPPGLERGFIQYQAPYMEIGTDHVLGVWTDELDVQ